LSVLGDGVGKPFTEEIDLSKIKKEIEKRIQKYILYQQGNK